MTRILLVETASPKRVRRTAELILKGGIYPDPQLTILCTQDKKTAAYFQEISGVEVLSLIPKRKRALLAQLRGARFDVMRVFWTGEKKYRRMKLLAWKAGIRPVDVEIGDSSVFRLTWKALLRFVQFRGSHPLPKDHYEFVEIETQDRAAEYYEGERILIIQSAAPPQVLRALEILKERRLFRDPRYTLLCRQDPEISRRFQGHPMLYKIRTHRETQGAWSHLRWLRRERFDGVVVFFTGDPSYWKVKYFAFLLGARHTLVFNENYDCFFFSWRAWLTLLAHRFGERSRVGGSPRWTRHVRSLLFVLTKLILFPFRLAWLMLVWLRLRLAN